MNSAHPAQRLRSAAWRLMAVRTLGRGPDDSDAARLVLAVAALVAELAAWQELNGYRAQAAAARAAAAQLQHTRFGVGVPAGVGAGPRPPTRSSAPTPARFEPSGGGGRAMGPAHPARGQPERGRRR